MNHKVLELTPEDFEPFVKKKRPDKLLWFHFNVNPQTFYDSDIVLFREDGKVMVMKDRYGTNDTLASEANPRTTCKR